MNKKFISYNRKILEDTRPYVLTDEKAANLFFTEAEKAFRVLIPYSLKTRRLFCYYMAKHHNNKDDFDDLVQDCLEKLWENTLSGDFKGVERVEGYLESIARFKMLEISQKNERRNNIAPVVETEDYFDFVDKKTYGLFNEDKLIEIYKKHENKVFPKGAKKREIGQFSRDYKLINSFKSIAEASKITGVDHTAIYRCCTHQRKTAGDFIWLYKDDEIIKLMEI